MSPDPGGTTDGNREIRITDKYSVVEGDLALEKEG